MYTYIYIHMYIIIIYMYIYIHQKNMKCKSLRAFAKRGARRIVEMVGDICLNVALKSTIQRRAKPFRETPPVFWLDQVWRGSSGGLTPGRAFCMGQTSQGLQISDEISDSNSGHERKPTLKVSVNDHSLLGVLNFEKVAATQQSWDRFAASSRSSIDAFR